MRKLILLIVLLTMAACVSVPLANPQEDAAAKTFAAPPGKAAIYLFRDESFGGLYPINVGLDGKTLGQTAAQIYFVWHVEPGHHQVSAYAENLSVLDIEAEAGKVYFVRQEIHNGWTNMRSTLQLVDETQGRQGVAACQLAAEQITP